MSANGLTLQIDPELLRPLIEQVVRETLAQVDADRAQVGDRLAYRESEAAALLGLTQTQLRDERIVQRRINASVGPGRKPLYSREDLVAYLASRRWQGKVK